MNWEVVKQLVEYGRSQEEAHGKHFRFTITTNGVLLMMKLWISAIRK